MLDQLALISSDPLAFYQFFGLFGLSLIIFAESGLFGFFLPGDSLLITLGLIAAEGHIELKHLIPSLFIATFLGDQLAYFLGRKFRDSFKFTESGLILNKKNFDVANEYYEAHGGKTILFCKFIAFVRTFAPFIAGTTGMSYFRFVLFDVFGAILWVAGLTSLGKFLGHSFNIDIADYFHYVFYFLVFLVISPFIIKILKRN